MQFKAFYFQLWRSICLTEQNHLGNFGGGPQKELLCKFILNLGLWYRRCHLKILFIILALVAILFSGKEFRNIYVNLS